MSKARWQISNTIVPLLLLGREASSSQFLLPAQEQQLFSSITLGGNYLMAEDPSFFD
jgi:hypothetical protein